MAVVKTWQSQQINVGSSWSFKLKLQAEVASWGCKLLTTIPIEDHNPNWRFEYADTSQIRSSGRLQPRFNCNIINCKRNKLQCWQKSEEMKLSKNYPKLSRHATTVIWWEYASISWVLITMSFYVIIVIGNCASGAKCQVQ